MGLPGHPKVACCKNNLLLPVLGFNLLGRYQSIQIHGNNKGSPDQDLSPNARDTAEMLHMAHLICILPSFLSTVGTQREERSKKDEISQSRSCSHTFCLWCTQTHVKASQSPGRFICSLQWVVGKCCSASFLSGSVCNVRVIVCVYVYVCA